VFEDLDENYHEKSFEGPWAWFRLQEESKLTKTNQANVFLVNYTVQDWADNKTAIIKRTIQYLIRAKSVNNPFSEDLLGSFKCPETI
jgi:type VI secretion system protein ImpL